MNRVRTIQIALLVLAFVGPAAQAEQPLTDADLLAMTKGKSWAISFVGNPDEPGVTQIWDFRSNGTLCARAVRTGPKEKCADIGKWKVGDGKVCWELTWLGEAYGYKRACLRAMKVDARLVKLIDESRPDASFAVLRVL